MSNDSMSGFNVSNEGRSRAFSLIELLVVVAVIIVLIAILVPSLELAMAAARKAKCLSHQGGIMNAIADYRTENDGRLFIRINDGRWRPFGYDGDATTPVVTGVNESVATGDPQAGFDRGASEFGNFYDHNPYFGRPDGYVEGSEWIDPWHPRAYWGVAYMPQVGNEREIYKCPDSTGADGWNSDENPQSTRPNIPDSFNTYSFNGAGGSTRRSPLFSPSGIGNTTAADKTPSTTVTFIDGWEAVMDNNGDLPSNLYENYYGLVDKDLPPQAYAQLWRHRKSGNYAFNDGHAENIVPRDTTWSELKNQKDIIKPDYFTQPIY